MTNNNKALNLILELGEKILLTTDHGNSEQMINYDTGMVKTSHTKFPVECIYIAKDSPGKKLLPKGKLSDIAPTVLYLMGLPVPKEITAEKSELRVKN